MHFYKLVSYTLARFIDKPPGQVNLHYLKCDDAIVSHRYIHSGIEYIPAF